MQARAWISSRSSPNNVVRRARQDGSFEISEARLDLAVRQNALEGGVRQAGDRVRITAQLNDAATGTHLWADRFRLPGRCPCVRPTRHSLGCLEPARPPRAFSGIAPTYTSVAGRLIQLRRYGLCARRVGNWFPRFLTLVASTDIDSRPRRPPDMVARDMRLGHLAE